MQTFICQACRQEKALKHKADRKGRCYCTTCHNRATQRDSTTHNQNYYRRVGRRYKAGIVPPFALS